MGSVVAKIAAPRAGCLLQQTPRSKKAPARRRKRRKEEEEKSYACEVNQTACITATTRKSLHRASRPQIQDRPVHPNLTSKHTSTFSNALVVCVGHMDLQRCSSPDRLHPCR